MLGKHCHLQQSMGVYTVYAIIQLLCLSPLPFSVIASLLYSYIKYKEQQKHINEESTQTTSSA